MNAVIDREYIARQQVIRQAILAVLYEKRRSNPSGYSRDLTHTLGHAPEECLFALEFLVELGLIRHKSIHCRITAQGINHFEREGAA